MVYEKPSCKKTGLALEKKIFQTRGHYVGDNTAVHGGGIPIEGGHIDSDRHRAAATAQTLLT